ncbi:hypothetical protein HAZT_HAZT006492, partial [Hyalella azteca]
MNAGASLTALI